MKKIYSRSTGSSTWDRFRTLGWTLASAGVLFFVCGGAGCTSSGGGSESDDELCATGQRECDGSCVYTLSDPAHCSECGLDCEVALVCSNGFCTTSCGAGETQCGSACADLNTNPSHCGACENGCASGMSCSAGACINGAGGGSGAGGSASGSGGNGTGTGGGGVVGECERPQGSCSSPEVRITEIDFGVPLTSYGSEWDTMPLPAALAAMPSGGTRVAARAADGNIHVATLDCNDQIIGTPFVIPAVDLQDIHSDDEGGVVLLTRDAEGGGAHNCGAGPLCGGESAPCYNSLLVRFDNVGEELWSTPVTNLQGDMEGYNVGARFVWNHYQHHGRIAFDGDNYAAYFCIGITTPGSGGNNSCVDIHQGDRIQMVNTAGSLVDHPQARPVGCSHSWTTRIVWDPRSEEFMMVCATDNPDPGTGSQCRIARPAYETIAPVDCSGQFWGGDLVLAEGSGYWTAYTQNGAINLVHFTSDGPTQSINNVGSADHAKLVTFGQGKMLLGWEQGSTMQAQIYNSSTGAEIESEFEINVEDHNYHAFKSFEDGSVAYPARGSSNTSLRIARVMPCD